VLISTQVHCLPLAMASWRSSRREMTLGSRDAVSQNVFIDPFPYIRSFFLLEIIFSLLVKFFVIDLYRDFPPWLDTEAIIIGNHLHCALGYMNFSSYKQLF
jgi:hypothetical protein